MQDMILTLEITLVLKAKRFPCIREVDKVDSKVAPCSNTCIAVTASYNKSDFDSPSNSVTIIFSQRAKFFMN